MAADATALTFAVGTRDSAVVLTPRGTLDSGTYRSLRDGIVDVALDEPRAVLVDVTDLDVPAESAWTVFTSARWHITRWPRVPIILVCAHSARRSAICRIGIDRYLPLYRTVEEAVDHLDEDALPRTRRRARAELPATSPSLQRGRELVTEWLTAWSRTDMIPIGKVVITTLVENVLQHTDSLPGIRIEYNGSTVTIAVTDQERMPATIREAADGRGGPPSGLQIVSALCRTWGNAPTTSGKAVWAEIGPENVL